jgi:hypothetical protein
MKVPSHLDVSGLLTRGGLAIAIAANVDLFSWLCEGVSASMWV